MQRKNVSTSPSMRPSGGIRASLIAWATNESAGKPDIDAIVKRHGADANALRDIVRKLESSFEDRFRIEVPGGIGGFVPPPPGQRRKLDAAIEDCELFTVHADSELDRILADRKDEYALAVPKGTKGAIGIERLGHILERATKEFFGGSVRTVLTYSVYLLLEAGGEYRPVSDYASELLKGLWQVLIPDRSADQVANFIRSYSI